MPQHFSPLDGFYLTLGHLTASLLWTLVALGFVVLTAYICARIEIPQERRAKNRKENRNA